MPSYVKHPSLEHRVRDSDGNLVLEPVMVNPHSLAEPWEYDPNWTPEQQAEWEQQKAEHKVEQEEKK